MVVRHPLHVAMSDRDHGANVREERAVELRVSVAGPAERGDSDPLPEDPAEFLRWFIDNDEPPTGSGPHGLDDYCQQVRTYWDARDAANVHLFHYADLWADRDGEMRRVATALGVPIDEERWPAFVEAAGLTSMRARAADTAPDAHMGIWESPERFFSAGGTRDWASFLSKDDVHFDARMRLLCGDATDGRSQDERGCARWGRGPIGWRGSDLGRDPEPGLVGNLHVSAREPVPDDPLDIAKVTRALVFREGIHVAVAPFLDQPPVNSDLADPRDNDPVSATKRPDSRSNAPVSKSRW